MKKTEISKILEQCFALDSALKTLGYAMEFMHYIDHDEEELRKISCHIEGSIVCLQGYHEKTMSDIESFMNELLKELGEAPESPEESPKYREERLIWVYRHMDEKDKGQLDHYCDKFHLAETRRDIHEN